MSQYDKDGRDREGKIGCGDLPRVRPADAVTLMVHHLTIAAAYFEATPESSTAFEAFKEELLDQCGALGKDDPAYTASVEFYKWAKHGHDQLKRETDR